MDWRKGPTIKILLSIDGSFCNDSAVVETATKPWPQTRSEHHHSDHVAPLLPTVEPWVLPLPMVSLRRTRAEIKRARL